MAPFFMGLKWCRPALKTETDVLGRGFDSHQLHQYAGIDRATERKHDRDRELP